MNIAILDDEEFYRKELQNILCRQYPDAIIHVFPTAKALLKSEARYDLLLLDIEMPQINGLDFAKEYLGRFPRIIYVSSHEERVFESFYPNVYGFVVKQMLSMDLIPVIEKVFLSLKQTIKLPIGNGVKKIDQREIIYFYIAERHIYVVTIKGELQLNIVSLKQLQLSEKFCTINRQVIINLNHVLHIHKQEHEIVMSDQTKLSVSKRNWSSFLQRYNQEVVL